MDNTIAKNKLITIAQSLLHHNPYDIGHDIHHHYSVFRNAVELVAIEDLEVDLDKLEIAIWWHDYKRKSDQHHELTDLMQRLEFAESYIDQVKKIINEHSYQSAKPSSIEAQVLFDADKIEYIDPTRYRYICLGYERGEISLERTRKYGAALIERLPEIIERINFNYTKQRLLQNFEILAKLLPGIQKKYPEFFKEVEPQELLRFQKLLAKNN